LLILAKSMGFMIHRDFEAVAWGIVAFMDAAPGAAKGYS